MKMMKRMLSVVLAVVMVLTTLTVTPVIAAEEEYVCHIGDTYYTSLEDAIDVKNDTGSSRYSTITLDADCRITTNVSLKYLHLTISGQDHSIYTDTTGSTASNKERGLQTNSTSSLTLNNVTMVGNDTAYTIYMYAGKVTCNNVTFCGNSKYNVISMNNNSSSHNLELVNCSFHDISVISLLINADNAEVTLRNTIFEDCTGDFDVKYIYGTSLSISGTNKTTINKLYLASGKTITPCDTTSESSRINLYLVSSLIGTQVLSGDKVSASYTKYKIPSSYDYVIGSDGKLAQNYEASWNGTKYTTLGAAITAMNNASGNDKTITLINDAHIDSRTNISRTGVIIKDDGTPRTIYVHNTNTTEAGGFGRGFQMGFSSEEYKVTFSATKVGYITIVGHSADGTKSNKAHVFAVRGGTLILERVIIKECINSSTGDKTKCGGAIHCQLSSATARGSVELSDCEIYDCQAAQGAAIYSLGGNVTLERTKIYDCASTADSGAVAIHDEPGEVTSELEHQGRLYLYDGVKIEDNHKTTTLAEINNGPLGNVSAEKYIQIYVRENQTNSDIGVDFGKEGEEFAFSPYAISESTFHRDQDDSLFVKRVSSILYWTPYTYSINWGDYTTSSTTSLGVTTYTYPNAAVNLEIGNGKALSVAVDNGSFNIDWSKLALTGISKYEAVLADGTFASGTMPTTGSNSYEAVTLYGDDISADTATTFVKALVFTNTGSGIAQNIDFGMSKILDDGDHYLAGSKYTYVAAASNWYSACLDAEDASSHLVYIGKKTENDFVNGITQGDVWTGACQKLNAWYWNDSTQFGANASSNEGYNGAYVNWKVGEPSGSGDHLIMNSSGKWVSADGNTSYGYVVEKDDSQVKTNQVVIDANVTTSILSSMNLSFDGDVSMYYYFLFEDGIKSREDYQVVVEIGSGEDKVEVSSTIGDMKNLTDSQGNYGIKVPVPAKMMGADVKIRLCNENRQTIRAYANFDGAHPEKNYNCLYYANYMYAQQADRYNQYYSEDLIAMITAMLNYGAAAQLQFNYDTENLVNEGHEDPSAVMANIPDEDIISYTGKNFASAYIVADSQTLVCLEYVGSEETEYYDIFVSFNGIKTNNFTYEDNTVKIPVSAQNLGKRLEVTFGSDYAILNVNYLLNQILIGEYESAQKLTSDRLYKFGKYADQYFGIFEQSTSAVEAVLETAYAYLAKETYSQYDQKDLSDVPLASSTDVPQNRRQLFASPEEMTDYHMNYMDCSSFCYSVYQNVFGAEATREAFLNSSNRTYRSINTNNFTYNNNDKSVVKTYSNLATSTWYNDTDQSKYISNWTNALEDAKTLLQPGDMIVYYGYNSNGKTGGHIVMWTGSGFIHCSGSDYKVDSESEGFDENGAVHYLTATEFNYTYLMKHGAQRVVILRPLNVLAKKDISESAIARTQLGSIAVEATGEDTTTGVELYQGQYVNDGDEVEYTIKITNIKMTGNLTVGKKVDVVYTPSKYLENIKVENGGSYNSLSNTITWKGVEVGVDKTVTLTYSGAVNKYNDDITGEVLDGGSGKIYLSDAGTKAVGLSFKAEEAEIEEKLPDNFAYNLTYVMNNITEFTQGKESATAAINAMLQYATGDSTKSIGSDDDDVMDSIRTLTSLGNYRPLLTDYWEDNIVSNFCGGRKFFIDTLKDSPYSALNRVRVITVNNLKIGDIIMTKQVAITYDETKKEESFKYYIYMGEDSMISVDSNLETSTNLSAAKVCESLNTRSLWGVFRLTK